MTARWRSWGLALALATVGAAAYLPALRGGFVFDDRPLLFSGDTPLDGPLWRVWLSGEMPDYLPLTWSTFWVEKRIFGEAPIGYHLVNVALHLAVALLLWRVLRALRVPGAWLAGLLFAVHPVTVESVAWISERKNTLSAVLFLGAVLAWVRSDDRREEAAAAKATPRLLDAGWVLSLGLFVLALLAKGSVVALPLVLLAIATIRRGRVTGPDLARTAPFFALALAGGLETLWFQRAHAIGAAPGPARGLLERLGGAGWALLHYIETAFVPIRLAFLAPEWPVGPGSPWFLIPLALIAALFLALWALRRRGTRPALLALGYQALMLLPVLGLVDMAWLALAPVSNHLQYLALMGPVAVVANGLARVAVGRWRPVAVAASIALVACFGAETFRRAHSFESDLTLWQAAVRDAPGSAVARYQFAQYLRLAGRTAAAEAQIEAMARVAREPSLRHRARSLVALQQGRYADATAEALLAERIRPDPRFLLDMGRSLVGRGAPGEAIAVLLPLATTSPDNPEPRTWLAVALFRAGRTAEARSELAGAMGLATDDPRVEATLRSWGGPLPAPRAAP